MIILQRTTDLYVAVPAHFSFSDANGGKPGPATFLVSFILAKLGVQEDRQGGRKAGSQETKTLDRLILFR